MFSRKGAKYAKKKLGICLPRRRKGRRENIVSVISTEGRLNRLERFEQPKAGPKGEGQDVRSKPTRIQEISPRCSRRNDSAMLKASN